MNELMFRSFDPDDNLGRRTSATFENGAAQAFGWDPVSRLASLTNDLSGTANDLSVTFAYNPASQIVQTVRTGDAYAYTAQGSGSTAYTSNGLNQQISIDGVAATWDAKGNLATEPQSNKAYCYSPENLLKRVSTPAAGCTSPSATLAYDPLLRLSQVTSSGTTRFAYNGADAVAEYDGSGNLLRRFIMDPTTGAPVMEFAGSGTGTSFHRFYGSDERGSIVSNSDISGNVVALNRYDEYGKPGVSNIGRYQYTGQKWIGEAGLYDYKARDYLPHLGIFAQTDPVGYADSPNLYAYVRSDPINLIDPLGLSGTCPPVPATDVNVCGHRPHIPGVIEPSAGLGGAPGRPGNRDDTRNDEQQEQQCPAPKGKGPVPVTLTNGSHVPNPNSATGVLMQPPGVSMSANAAQAESWLGVTATFHMIENFHPGGSEDYQRSMGSGGLINRNYIDFGNFNYGVVAAAAGYTLDEAQMGAGIANLIGTGSKAGMYFGNPRNQPMIAAGWRAYNNGLIGC